ncbi:MAG: alpha/beta fold hydrolase [Alphaproteobacteria bacterium]|nr:alpha/beta fold hydrolase [Alphaproteobacteria bacterium]
MRLLFLPGVGADGRGFWQPVADRLPAAWDKIFFDWPGLGRIPPAPDVNSFDDLVARVAARLDAPAVLLAQSMGGVIAVRAAQRRPENVAALVLTATSGGIDLAPFGVSDWRPAYRVEHPAAPAWVYDRGPDLSATLAALDVPALLVWATRDALSPAPVGRHLAGLLPRARLLELDSDDHWAARLQADVVAPAIEQHVRAALSAG